jgi:hypothetical protein
MSQDILVVCQDILVCPKTSYRYVSRPQRGMSQGTHRRVSSGFIVVEKEDYGMQSGHPSSLGMLCALCTDLGMLCACSAAGTHKVYPVPAALQTLVRLLDPDFCHLFLKHRHHLVMTLVPWHPRISERRQVLRELQGRLSVLTTITV